MTNSKLNKEMLQMEKRIIGKFQAIKSKKITVKESKIDVLFSYVQKVDPFLFDKLNNEYNKILEKQDSFFSKSNLQSINI